MFGYTCPNCGAIVGNGMTHCCPTGVIAPAIITYPQPHAETCPVCWGKGKIKTNTTAAEEICHGCGGLGWVRV